MTGHARRRLRGLLRKEFLQIRRDPSAIAIAFLLPAVLLLLFGYGVSLDARNVPIALVVEHPEPLAASFAGKFAQSPYFRPQRFATFREAERAMAARRVDGIVWLRNDFARRVLNARAAPVAVIVNGVDANNSRLVEGYLDGALATWLAQRAQAQGLDPPIPVGIEHRVWYNPDLRSRNFLVPGLVVVIMTLTGALLTAMVMAREWERGTMEALLVTPVAAGEILLGKLVPYFILGIGGMLLSVAMARWLFGVPLAGSFWLLLATSSVFLLVALGMGLLISSVAKSQYVAGQVALITTFLPAFLLSGMIFPIASLPDWLRPVTVVVPARWFIVIARGIMLKGVGLGYLWQPLLVLAVMLVVLMALAVRNFKPRLG